MLAPEHFNPVGAVVSWLLAGGPDMRSTAVELLTPCLGLGHRVAGLRIRQQAKQAEAAVVVLRASL